MIVKMHIKNYNIKFEGQTIFADFKQYILKSKSKILCVASYLMYQLCVGLLLIWFTSISSVSILTAENLVQGVRNCSK